jgi:hypothetical protein
MPIERHLLFGVIAYQNRLISREQLLAAVDRWLGDKTQSILQVLMHDQASRSRFLLEAEITGGLEHPGIVPIYGLGAAVEGRPYYAMRFIKGDNLATATQTSWAQPSVRPTT